MADVLIGSSDGLVRLYGEHSTDPDGNNLTYNWFQYTEAGTLNKTVQINNNQSPKAQLTTPKTKEDRIQAYSMEMHFIYRIAINDKAYRKENNISLSVAQQYLKRCTGLEHEDYVDRAGHRVRKPEWTK